MKKAWIAAGLFLLTCFLYAQTGAFGFLNWDDRDFVTDNAHVKQGLTAESIQWALTTDHIYWQPLVYLSHMAMVSAAGLNPALHHLLNALLHAINVALWFWILHRLRFPIWTAAIAAALFGWHPLRAESVAWISERKDVLSGLFWLLAIWAYIRYVEAGRSWSRYAIVAAFFVLALMSKPVAVTLPLLFLLLDYWPLGGLNKSTLKPLILEKVPLLALSAASSLITIAGQRTAEAVSDLTLTARGINALRSYAMYVKQTAWPEDLSPLYPLLNSYPAWQILGSALLVGLLSWIAWKTWKSSPWWAVGWVWFLVALAPNIGILQVGAQAHADRYTYLPATMLVASACFGVRKWVEGSPSLLRWAGIGAGVWCTILFLWSAVQITYWKDEFQLYGRMAEITPNSAIPYNNLGLMFDEQKQYAKALEFYEESIRLDPGYLTSRVNATLAYLNSNQPAKALPHAEAAVRLEPGRAPLYLHLGRTLMALDRLDEAKSAFRKGLGLTTMRDVLAATYMQLGVAEYMSKNDEGALAAFRSALAADPAHAPARKNAAIALGNMGRTAEAIAEFETYLKSNPSDTSVQAAIDALRKAK